MAFFPRERKPRTEENVLGDLPEKKLTQFETQGREGLGFGGGVRPRWTPLEPKKWENTQIQLGKVFEVNMKAPQRYSFFNIFGSLFPSLDVLGRAGLDFILVGLVRGLQPGWE